MVGVVIVPSRMSSKFPFTVGRGFDAVLGIEYGEVSAESAHASVPVTDELKQPFGLVHGGVYAAIAESLASLATGMAVVPEGQIAVGLSNHTSFLRPITDGTISAVATRKHRGRTTWVWEVECSDEEGRLCALTRVTMAVRDGPG